MKAIYSMAALCVAITIFEALAVDRARDAGFLDGCQKTVTMILLRQGANLRMVTEDAVRDFCKSNFGRN